MLSMRIHNLGDVTIFRCAGRIMFPHADTLRAVILRQPRVRVVVLDLAEISAVDAAGLGALVFLRGWARTLGMRLKLMNLAPRLEVLLELTYLRSVFEICSAQDMLELLCRAFEQSRFVGTGLLVENLSRIPLHAESLSMEDQE